jgi:hypothetical protein
MVCNFGKKQQHKKQNGIPVRGHVPPNNYQYKHSNPYKSGGQYPPATYYQQAYQPHYLPLFTPPRGTPESSPPAHTQGAWLPLMMPPPTHYHHQSDSSQYPQNPLSPPEKSLPGLVPVYFYYPTNNIPHTQLSILEHHNRHEYNYAIN